MASSFGKRVKHTANRGQKIKEHIYSNKFLSQMHERHFQIVQNRRLLMERKMRDMYMSLMESRMEALYRGEQAIMMNLTSAFPERKFMTQEEFQAYVAWPADPTQDGGGAGASSVATVEEDEEEEEEDEDEEEDEEDDSDDSRG
ncbi:hypothetical protein LR48_Vigan04g149100 [Vigna angularis]|uniref:Uncharacterized protein n=1 Tax=Phaseolus angularis TaxID=3914 RepID=A0A0L9UEX1_PHAAN|nr:hypothetical protein LR48_Vigan04g149100 [Vigna angularis]